MDKKEEEDDSIFTTWRQGFDQEVVTEELDAERKSSLNVPRPRRSIANRRASLPCPATLNAMQLQHLHNATMAPNPASHSTRKEGELRQHYRACHAGINGGDVCPKANSTPERERRAPAIPTIPEVTETPEKKTRFRGRNVMSLDGIGLFEAAGMVQFIQRGKRAADDFLRCLNDPPGVSPSVPQCSL
ncbi:uncharacterized protein si:ch211-207l14.1 isoform X2 [Alosa sapidissima]|uniref:uncharacterized protein si:ch211-207l14.1 isoform X2 n=1 Tax=Alosa sapidissima TaxID=34773 RepID=UPI001C09B451|nr:uncharacterized protein si:ch211-207l14.1 isoform X2 [Alosa sapidissima]